MNIEKIFPHVVTLVLLGFSVWQRSALLSYAAVLSMAVALAKDAWDKKNMVKDNKVTLPEDAKRQMQDLAQRVTTLEYGVKTRGF